MSAIRTASASASAAVFINAPAPYLTSSTITSLPPAIFLLITDAAMSGALSTVAVTSRSAYRRLSAGTSDFVCPATHTPTRLTIPTNASAGRSVRSPGMLSSLSIVPPVKPSPRPDSFATRTPQSAAATSGQAISVVLSPMPPVLCLSALTPPTPDRSTVSPLCAMQAVKHAVSPSVIPVKQTAIRNAASW